MQALPVFHSTLHCHFLTDSDFEKKVIEASVPCWETFLFAKISFFPVYLLFRIEEGNSLAPLTIQMISKKVDSLKGG